MLDLPFTSIIESEISVRSFLLCTLTSLILGIISAFGAMIKNNKNKSMALTLTLLPAITQTVIMMVNGNIGAGVAVMGTFSLVRYRSNPGTASEILVIFFSMSIGLMTGMGYIWLAAIYTIIILAVYILLNVFGFGVERTHGKELKVTIPEGLNYTSIFDDIFEKYTKSYRLLRVRTTNMGSLYQLYYHIELIDEAQEKEMLDEIRCRNGNLDIICGMTPQTPGTL
ncbi:MAG: DUF4956 domain-containing protein [Eubacteriales bacterium]|jgi:uncharacterized membrane protein YhiD involved in acid resistance|nr:DUF4956 domain-containing protein [Clostridiales bacterium]